MRNPFIIGSMLKLSVLLRFAALSFHSYSTEVLSLPPPEFADTEVSTNFTFAVDSGNFRRTYEVRSRSIDPSWNLVKVTRRGLGVSSENVSFSLVESGFGLTIR